MNNIEREITTLTQEWSDFLDGKKVKDEDYCWYIHVEWSDGLPPVYFVRYDGKFADNIERRCSSYEEAQEVLKKVLKNTIERLKM